METAEIAREALRILDRDGWNKGYLTYTSVSWDDGESVRAGSHCIGGAWNLALHGDSRWVLAPRGGMTILLSEPYELLAEAIREQYPAYTPYPYDAINLIAEWNNDPATTEDDVRAILEKLAAG